MKKRWLIFIPMALILSASAKDAPDWFRMKDVIDQLKPLHLTITKPAPSDWLAQHREPGQTFKEYLTIRPQTPRGKRRVIYIQPLGDFTEDQDKIVRLTADFMGRYFHRPVKIKKRIGLDVIPEKARRTHPVYGMKQILSTYVLDDVLKPNLPADAAAYIAFTATDLWPGKGWNFVFGQASLRNRVGVWSINRNGDPSLNEDAFKLCLMRTMKTAVHETGHMFSLYHCILYECCMCGSNHREESDRRPVWLCPECVAKVTWAVEVDPAKRYLDLAEFCEKNGFEQEAKFYQKSADKLSEDISL